MSVYLPSRFLFLSGSAHPLTLVYRIFYLPYLHYLLIQPNRSPVTFFHIRNKASQVIKLPTSNFAR